MAITYHQNVDGTHIIKIESNSAVPVLIRDVVTLLVDIHYQSHHNSAYIVLDFERYDQFPLREFVMCLKQFYRDVEMNQLRVALVVQSSLVRVLEAVVKTLVTRESIQYFTDTERALLWLHLERGRNVA
ncbi:MAG: STAS/SEC14 domain-containing protein [Phototrophicaceae bacterium]